jgi:O-acetyl-ADP-ribose deacetylase (regulator of RNase III)
MIRYTTGNLLDAPVDALVNTVNEKGVMGKGIALMFREGFPESARVYEQAAKRGEVRVGKVLVTEEHRLGGPRWIIHFPTKQHWRNPSKLGWVRDGLTDLVRVIAELQIASIALPPLGAGNGKLPWPQVRAEIERALGALGGVDVLVFEPASEYLNTPKATGVQSLTPARALIAEIIRRYSVLGMECSLIEVQKLAWFLQRSIRSLALPDPLRLEFKADKYGPYADALRHLLNGLDGSYLHGAKRMADSGPFDPIWADVGRGAEVETFMQSQAAVTYVPALTKATAVIDGFESPLGMELLATVDWCLFERKAAPTIDGVRRILERWPGTPEAGERKQRLFSDRMIELALNRLVVEQPFG